MQEQRNRWTSLSNGDTCDGGEETSSQEARERKRSTGKRVKERRRNNAIIRDEAAAVDYNGNEAVTVNYK